MFTETDVVIVETKLTHTCEATNRNSWNNLQQTLRFPIEFKSEIVMESLSSNIQAQYDYNSTMVVEFKHVYLLTNVGPSPTNKPFIFNVYIPSTEALDIRRVESNFECAHMIGGLVAGIHSPYTSGTKALSCQVETCSVHQCTIPTGMAKDQVESVELNMAFQAEKAEVMFENVYHFAVYTAVRQQGRYDSTEFKKILTEFYSLEVSSLAAMAISHWPYIIGVVVGLLLLALIFALLWKCDVFSKTRLFKKQLDEVEIMN